MFSLGDELPLRDDARVVDQVDAAEGLVQTVAVRVVEGRRAVGVGFLLNVLNWF